MKVMSIQVGKLGNESTVNNGQDKAVIINTDIVFH